VQHDEVAEGDLIVAVPAQLGVGATQPERGGVEGRGPAAAAGGRLVKVLAVARLGVDDGLEVLERAVGHALDLADAQFLGVDVGCVHE
jgi:hypothetical protein